MRVDRVASLYVFHPLASRRGLKFSVPILMYHSISEAIESGHPYFHTRTSPARFAAQMRYLSESGYSAVRLSEVADLFAGHRRNIQKPVVITFDDGYRDFYTHAYPVLAKHKLSASMFLPTAYIADPRLNLNQTECMTWTEVRELAKAGIEFGSHTVTHPQLTNLRVGEIEVELRKSRETIEDELGTPVTCFAYPYAFPETMQSFVEELKGILVRCDYRTGVSTAIGTATADDDPFFMRRLPVNTSDDLALFRAKLEGGYDWLHGLQRLKKTFIRMVAV